MQLIRSATPFVFFAVFIACALIVMDGTSGNPGAGTSAAAVSGAGLLGAGAAIALGILLHASPPPS